MYFVWQSSFESASNHLSINCSLDGWSYQKLNMATKIVCTALSSIDSTDGNAQVGPVQLDRHVC